MQKPKNKEVEDKVNCFARISATECNALSKKECANCGFYKHYTEVKGYEKYLPRKFVRKEVELKWN